MAQSVHRTSSHNHVCPPLLCPFSFYFYTTSFATSSLTMLSLSSLFVLLIGAFIPLWILPSSFGALAAGAFCVQFGVQGAWGVVSNRLRFFHSNFDTHCSPIYPSRRFPSNSLRCPHRLSVPPSPVSHTSLVTSVHSHCPLLTHFD